MPNTKKAVAVGGLLAVSLLILAQPALASTVLDSATSKFEQATKVFGQNIKDTAFRLLLLLAGIQLSVNMVMLLLKEIDFSAVLGSVMRWMLSTGFFFALIKFSDTYLPAILNSFDMLGQQGSGLAHLTPSAIITQGIELQNMMVSQFNESTGADKGLFAAVQNFLPAAMITLIAIISFLSFVMLAAQMALAIISGYLWLCITPLLLGFGGISFTKDIAVNSLKGGIAIGMKILVVYLIVGVAGTLAPVMGDAMKDVTLTDWSPMFWTLALSLIMAYLSMQLPKLAADLMNGTASLSAGDAGSNMVMMAAATAGVGAAALSAAKVTGAAMQGASSALASGTGLMQALSAGAAVGGDLGKTGLGKAMHAVGEVAGQAAGMASQGIGGKVAQATDGFSSKVANSTGGKIASGIEASRGGSMGPVGGSQDAPMSAASGASAPSAGAGRNLGGYAPSGPEGSTSNMPAASSVASALDGGGDASTASISGGGAELPKGGGTGGPRLHERIRSAAHDLPQDGHTVGLSANITANVGD